MALGAIAGGLTLIGSAATAIYIASVWKEIRVRERARFGSRAYWTVMKIGTWNGELPDVESETIRRMRVGALGTIHPDGAKRYGKVFHETYALLKKLPPAHRQAFCKAMLAMREEYHRKS